MELLSYRPGTLRKRAPGLTGRRQGTQTPLGYRELTPHKAGQPAAQARRQSAGARENQRKASSSEAGSPTLGHCQHRSDGRARGVGPALRYCEKRNSPATGEDRAVRGVCACAIRGDRTAIQWLAGIIVPSADVLILIPRPMHRGADREQAIEAATPGQTDHSNQAGQGAGLRSWFSVRGRLPRRPYLFRGCNPGEFSHSSIWAVSA